MSFIKSRQAVSHSSRQEREATVIKLPAGPEAPHGAELCWKLGLRIKSWLLREIWQITELNSEIIYCRGAQFNQRFGFSQWSEMKFSFKPSDLGVYIFAWVVISCCRLSKGTEIFGISADWKHYTLQVTKDYQVTQGKQRKTRKSNQNLQGKKLHLKSYCKSCNYNQESLHNT